MEPNETPIDHEAVAKRQAFVIQIKDKQIAEMSVNLSNADVELNMLRNALNGIEAELNRLKAAAATVSVDEVIDAKVDKVAKAK